MVEWKRMKNVIMVPVVGFCKLVNQWFIIIIIIIIIIINKIILRILLFNS